MQLTVPEIYECTEWFLLIFLVLVFLFTCILKVYTLQYFILPSKAMGIEFNVRLPLIFETYIVASSEEEKFAIKNNWFIVWYATCTTTKSQQKSVFKSEWNINYFIMHQLELLDSVIVFCTELFHKNSCLFSLIREHNLRLWLKSSKTCEML